MTPHTLLILLGRKLSDAVHVYQSEIMPTPAKESGLYLLRQTSFGNQCLYRRSKAQIRDRMREEEELEDILDTVLEVRPGIRPYHVGAT
jgi:hypothetical protein